MKEKVLNIFFLLILFISLKTFVNTAELRSNLKRKNTIFHAFPSNTSKLLYKYIDYFT